MLTLQFSTFPVAFVGSLELVRGFLPSRRWIDLGRLTHLRQVETELPFPSFTIFSSIDPFDLSPVLSPKLRSLKIAALRAMNERDERDGKFREIMIERERERVERKQKGIW